MASTVVTHMIIFIAVLSIAAGLMVAVKNFADETEGAFGVKSDKYTEYIKTSINIDVVNFNNITNITHIYVRNTGKTIIKPEEIDVYMDGVRLLYNQSNRSVVSDTERINIGKWDSRELLHIEAEGSLNDTIEHEVVVITPNSFRDSETFSI